jgi:hypothetical protein
MFRIKVVKKAERHIVSCILVFCKLNDFRDTQQETIAPKLVRYAYFSLLVRSFPRPSWKMLETGNDCFLTYHYLLIIQD